MPDKEKPEWIIDESGAPAEGNGEGPVDGSTGETRPEQPESRETEPRNGEKPPVPEETAEGGGKPPRRGGRKSGRPAAKKAGQAELLDLIQQKNAMLQSLEKRAEAAEKQIELKEDKLLRVAAEFENYRKRTRREWELHQKQANAGLIKDILGVIDDFDRALEAAPDEDDTFASGIRLIHSGLLGVLGRAGLSEIEAAGRPFDPRFHEAMGETATEEVPEGHVAHVIQKGYLFGGELLRPARVIVAKKPEAE